MIEPTHLKKYAPQIRPFPQVNRGEHEKNIANHHSLLVIHTVTFLSRMVGGHLAFERVTFSPSQKKSPAELPGRGRQS